MSAPTEQPATEPTAEVSATQTQEGEEGAVAERSWSCWDYAVTGEAFVFGVAPDSALAWIVVASGFVHYFAFFFCLPSMPVLYESFRSNATAGQHLEGAESFALLTFASTLCLGISRIVALSSSWLLRHLSARVLLTASSLSLFLALFVSSFVTSVAALTVVFTLFMSLCFGLVPIPGSCAIASFIVKNRAVALSLFNAGVTCGGGVGPLVIGYAVNSVPWFEGDWRLVFRAFSALAAAPLLASQFTHIRHDPKPATPLTDRRQFSYMKMFCNRNFAVLAVYCFTWGFAVYSASFMYFPHATRSTGLTPSEANLIGLVASFVSIVSSIALARIADWIENPRLVGIVAGVGAGITIFVWPTQQTSFGTAMAIQIARVSLVLGINSAVFIAQAFPRHTADALSTQYIFIGIGAAAGPPICAAMVDNNDFGPPLYLTGAVAFLGAIALFFFDPSLPSEIYEEREPAAAAPDALGAASSELAPAAAAAADAAPSDFENREPPSVPVDEGAGSGITASPSMAEILDADPRAVAELVESMFGSPHARVF